jgi:Immunoglobulin I-set domain.
MCNSWSVLIGMNAPVSLVAVPPDILYDETSADLSVQEGENATLVCKATGHPPPRITWRREDGEPILLRRGPRDVIKGECVLIKRSLFLRNFIE